MPTGFIKVLKLKQNLKKNEVIAGKFPFFAIGRFCTHYILFVLTMASDMTVVYGNDAFSILVLSTKKRYSSFHGKGFRFPQNLFQS